MLTTYSAQKAVAQLRGRHIAPVAFSFGFVSYSFTSLLSAIGDGRLMPMSDCPSLLINLSSDYSRTNNSWILGRILRDIEKRLATSKASLHVSVYRTTAAGGLNLEDLATARGHPVHHTRLLLGALAVCWIAFLLCVAGLEENTWYLLGVGFLGMVQNVTAAGMARDPSAMGVPMESIDEIFEGRVMQMLQETERRYPKVGLSLLPIFFPGELRPDEKMFFDEMRATAKERLKAEQEARPPPTTPTPPSSSSSSRTLTPSFSEKEKL
ncbi:hypothetical protein SLS58_003947 [Diplodia intermedia]|uniref:Uncharacterized protein n=1 Tax=Diplodia intermedia TaxID=856260 RepID=A0ABR3TV65_9PEZI